MTARITAVPPSYLSRTLYPRVTVAEYHQMIEDGAFGDGDRIELLEGYLVQKMSHNTPHSVAVQKLIKRLVRLAPPGWEPRSQLPITLSDSEPEPDGLLAKGDETTFAAHHPLPAEIGIVIEVADSSLHTDRNDKGRIYARAGIPVYWIVNVADRQVEVYTNPDTTANPPAYRTRTDHRPGDPVPVVLDGTTTSAIPVNELLP
ncbi:Uma2 family endonuclease [Gemmata sp. G18]|uniref:Uma2 family endonuclease n=1 Tax=Gemmata palustris TaxID=2822762 RepID=A0ABS5BX54_9BACT|nr:Uma2 family endonuclease [Gemmata palustris]MBP3957448.1 Uma2 family endonuclease [Gemmata palustris]